MRELIKGADLSTLAEVEACGGRFFDNGREGGAMEILGSHGLNLVRLRLWNDPYDPDGAPYGAGTCDLPHVMALAGRAKRLGIPWMLDFHYSDFWADPGKQIPPKAWLNLGFEALIRAVEEYTEKTLEDLREADLAPSIVAVGNEVTNGLLWPAGRRPDDAAMTALISAGIRAVRRVLPEARVMIHLDNGGNSVLYRDWFDSYQANGGEDFDLIGLSYYPFWHGSLSDLQNNMTALASRCGKPMIVTETSMGFTLEDYGRFEGLSDGARKGMAATATLAARVPYPMTPQGQVDFLRDLTDVVRSIPGGLGLGWIWWEAAWIPVPGSQWANAAALDYIGDPGPGGNEWANQALFDYEGNALPAVALFEKNCADGAKTEPDLTES